MTSAQGGADPLCMAEMYTAVAVQPPSYPDKLEKALVSGPYPVANTTSTQ